MINNFCIYSHTRLDTNKVFYIGIGNYKRPYSKKGRNNYWNNIICKTDYEITILKRNLTWVDAQELEVILINHYGRVNNNTGILCNMTDGGEGSTGVIVSNETRLKLSFNRKNVKVLQSSKIKMSLSKKDKCSLGDNNHSKKVINIETSEIFDSAKEASLSINKIYSSFIWSINNKKNYNFKYYI